MSMSCFPSTLKVYPIRLTPGQSLYPVLNKFVADNGLKSAFVMTCCGSVDQATLRFAARSDGQTNRIETFHEHFEICSLVGTVTDTSGHLHITLGRADGSTLSGHVMGDMRIFTTAEIVLGSCDDVTFTREFDDATGFDELVIKKAN